MPKKPSSLEMAKIVLSQKAREIRNLQSAMRTAIFNYDHELEVFEHLAKEYPELLDDGAKDDIKYIMEQVAQITDIKNFKLTGDTVPFFSEAKLYDLVGKDDARSILARIKTLLDITNA